jgi:hypothetical protein
VRRHRKANWNLGSIAAGKFYDEPAMALGDSAAESKGHRRIFPKKSLELRIDRTSRRHKYNSGIRAWALIIFCLRSVDSRLESNSIGQCHPSDHSIHLLYVNMAFPLLELTCSAALCRQTFDQCSLIPQKHGCIVWKIE